MNYSLLHQRHFFSFLWMAVLMFALSYHVQAQKGEIKDDGKEKKANSAYALFQLGYIIHTSPWTDNSGQVDPYTLSLQSSFGYQSNRYMLGMGTGINLYSRGYVVPAYLEIRGNLVDGKISPHYYGQLGTSIPIYNRESNDWWSIQNFDADGGILLDTGLGLSIRNPESFSWVFTLGYRSQKITERYGLGGTTYKDEYVFRRLSFQIGLLF